MLKTLSKRKSPKESQPAELLLVNRNLNELIVPCDGIEFNIMLLYYILGGFSMGGCLAMHAGYLLNHQLAGVFACSSFLNKGSIVYETLKKFHGSSNLPSLLMFHGNRDTLVPLEWGRTSYDQLQQLGVKGDFRVLNNTLHELKTNELNELKEWILKLLPPLQDDAGAKL